jgi:acyl-CoA reductase-like NAD-dependent aldehyde dehydrogenase
MTDNILISYDPSNGEIIGQVERTRIEDIPEKVQVARKDFSWGIPNFCRTC